MQKQTIQPAPLTCDCVMVAGRELLLSCLCQGVVLGQVELGVQPGASLVLNTELTDVLLQLLSPLDNDVVKGCLCSGDVCSYDAQSQDLEHQGC